MHNTDIYTHICTNTHTHKLTYTCTLTRTHMYPYKYTFTHTIITPAMCQRPGLVAQCADPELYTRIHTYTHTHVHTYVPKIHHAYIHHTCNVPAAWIRRAVRRS